LYSLDLLFRRLLTLPDAVKWNQFEHRKKAGVLRGTSFTAVVGGEADGERNIACDNKRDVVSRLPQRA